MEYQVKIKVNGKFFTVGNVKPNQYGNLSLGLKVGPELMNAVKEKEGAWLNLSLFEADRKEQKSEPIADEVPF